ncbi:MAG: Gfo/Idh/MocA family oxidoreductase [Acidimicrobiia bacterium]|nr:Gfo/Idh/MocA family oxidoreductase [Acidimicrobiia bacterium]
MCTQRDELRVGVIGLGGMGLFHARVLNEMDGVTVTALADPPNPRLGELADELDAAVAADPMRLATSAAVDAVVIASPDETHASLALAMIEAGRPVLCEKPLAVSVAEAAEVVDAEERLGRKVLQLGFMREYDAAHRQVATALADLGSIHHIRCVHTNTVTTPRSLQVIVGQSMVHDIHSVRFLTGAEFEWVSADHTSTADGTPRHVLVMARLSNGAHATLEFDDEASAYHVSVEITGERGVVTTGQQLRAEVRRDGFRVVEEGADWFARFDQAYRTELVDWVAAARAGGASGPTAADGLASQLVVDAIVESVHRGTRVAVG